MAWNRERWAKGLGEVFIVFVGVTLGLFAENWRENRKDETVVLALLGQLESDLHTDSVQMARLLRSTDLGHQRGLDLLKELARPAIRSEYALGSALSLIPGVVYRPAATAYGSLKEGGHLALVGDVTLRNAISVYYEQDQSLVAQLSNDLFEYQRQFRQAVGLHMRLGVSDSTTTMLDVPGFQWTTSADAFARDPAIHIRVEDLAIASAELRARLEPILARNAELRSALLRFKDAT